MRSTQKAHGIDEKVYETFQFQIVEHFIHIMGKSPIKFRGKYSGHQPYDTCEFCEGGIELTDVEGHYSGLCKTCRDHDANQW